MFESNLNLNICQKRCGSNLTLSQRWLEGSHPTEEGESAEAVAFFDFDNNPKYKSAPVSIHLRRSTCHCKSVTNCTINLLPIFNPPQARITNCGDYFVYFLEEAPAWDFGYCTVD